MEVIDVMAAIVRTVRPTVFFISDRSVTGSRTVTRPMGTVPQGSRLGPAEDVPSGPRPRSRYRADIQGLRAVAVMAVIAAHLAGWPRGSFVGVDIFFVISGYLITGILVREFERREAISFTGLLQESSRRARRRRRMRSRR
jgi:hypothetical protein